MSPTRRTLLNGVSAVGTGLLAGCGMFRGSCEVACFEFSLEGYDDAPDWLTIRHVGGRNLPAREVFITNVVTNAEDAEWVTETVAWHEVDGRVRPTDGIAALSVRVDVIDSDDVQVLWRHDGDEQVLAEPPESL